MAKLAREEEAKEQELESSIQVARENINQQNNNDTSPIEQWRKSPYYDPQYDAITPKQYLIDANRLYPGKPGYDDQFKF
ncbi:MAG: hypothetical protein MRJ93_05130 [Nitrososphaeraceae archaeon]|nr:hypothetical protein [Nitrososphaeraceae archaeon]